MAVLIQEHDVLENEVYDLDGPIFTIGKRENCNLTISEVQSDAYYISREHAFLLQKGEEFYLGSMASQSPTLLSRKGLVGNKRPISIKSILTDLEFASNYFSDPLVNGEGEQRSGMREYFLEEYSQNEENFGDLIKRKRIHQLHNEDRIILGSKESIIRMTYREKA
jgi:hypothetical protein